MDHTKRMGEGPIGRLLLKFSIPGMLGATVNMTYNLVDRAFVGRKVVEMVDGKEIAVGLGALSVCFPIMLVMMAVGMTIGIGSNTLISINLGKQRKDVAEKILGQGVAIFAIFSIAFTLLGLRYLDPMLEMVGATERLLPYARDYMSVIMLGIFFHMVSFGVNSFIRGEGSPRVAMITMFLAAGLNIFLDWLLVWQLDWGVRGAAIATVAAQTISAIWVIGYYFLGFSTLRIRRSNFRISPQLTATVVLMGFPYFFMNTASCIMNVCINKQLGVFGSLPVGTTGIIYGSETAIAAWAVIWMTLFAVCVPMIGISQGMQPLLGYNYGAKKYDRVRKTYKISIIAATFISVGMFVVIQLFPQFLFMLLSNDNPELVQLGTHAVRRFLMMTPLIGFMFISNTYFQAVGRPIVMLTLSVMRQGLILIPVVLILPNYWGMDGIWYAGPISDFTAFIFCLGFLVLEHRRLHRLEQSTIAPDDNFHPDDSPLDEPIIEPSA